MVERTIPPHTRSALSHFFLYAHYIDVYELQRYTIYRKMPMLARQERTLAIDGVYVHVSLSGREWTVISSCA